MSCADRLIYASFPHWESSHSKHHQESDLFLPNRIDLVGSIVIRSLTYRCVCAVTFALCLLARIIMQQGYSFSLADGATLERASYTEFNQSQSVTQQVTQLILGRVPERDVYFLVRCSQASQAPLACNNGKRSCSGTTPYNYNAVVIVTALPMCYFS